MWRVVLFLVAMACSKASTDGADTQGSGSQAAAPPAPADKKSDKSAADVMKASIEAAKARAAAQTPPPADPPPPEPPSDPMPPETTAPVAVDPLPPETPASAPEFKVGDRVMAKWDNAKWYPGRIVGIKDGTYDVNYDDGDKSRGLPAHRVRKPAATTSSGGDRTSTSKSDAPCPGPGLTRRCNGTCVNIQENSNHCGGCNNRCPSGKRCDGHMSCRDADGNL